ncbi:MAG TPA: rRNA maturation RNase YbeY [Candidatus Udaeobacter sp.]|nr:rRNA maturation RNase YbeY [Candidatus Udaeobacter sp.]
MTSPDISVRNRQRKIPVNVPDLEIFARKALRRRLQLQKRKPTDLDKLDEVFVWLISARQMASLHRKFMHQTGPTDVLTFQHGEIFISVDTAKRHARSFRNSLEGELCRYVVHGLLHLNGFDDQTQTGARKMEKMQERILHTCRALCEHQNPRNLDL